MRCPPWCRRHPIASWWIAAAMAGGVSTALAGAGWLPSGAAFLVSTLTLLGATLETTMGLMNWLFPIRAAEPRSTKSTAEREQELQERIEDIRWEDLEHCYGAPSVARLRAVVAAAKPFDKRFSTCITFHDPIGAVHHHALRVSASNASPGHLGASNGLGATIAARVFEEQSRCAHVATALAFHPTAGPLVRALMEVVADPLLSTTLRLDLPAVLAHLNAWADQCPGAIGRMDTPTDPAVVSVAQWAQSWAIWAHDHSGNRTPDAPGTTDAAAVVRVLPYHRDEAPPSSAEGTLQPVIGRLAV